MPTASIYNWIYRGWITARRGPGGRNWIITADDRQLPSSASAGTARPATTPAPAGHRPSPKAEKHQKKDKKGSHENRNQLDR